MKTARAGKLDALPVAFFWGAALVVWAAVRAYLGAAFHAPWVGPGLLILLVALACLAWAVLEEPRLAPGGGRQLWSWGAAVLLLGAGQSLLYDELPGKEALAPLGAALLMGGAGLVWPKGPGRGLALATAAVLALLGVEVLARQNGVAWDLFQGPLKGQLSILFVWLLLALGLAGLSLQASRLELRSASKPLTLPQEAWALGAIVLAGALLRFIHPGQLPQGFWYDEINLARAIQEDVLGQGRVPLYVGEQVENPGAWLWVGAAVFKLCGPSLRALRVASGFLGLLAVLPLWGLARLWVGGRWALLAAALYACMRWTLIPQRIAFMSGFALFWMLAAYWALWWAWLRGGAWRWLLAGLTLGANLHTYTPARFVPVIVAAFLLLQLLPGLRKQGPRLGLSQLGSLAGGFLLSAGPMLLYIAGHWADYVSRSKQVSIFTDVAKSGHPLLPELWGTSAKHLLMFQFRGDFNARHNLHFMPHVDLVTAAGLALAFPLVLGQAFRDARARFLLLWLGAMLAAGALTMPVEAPQGHRTVLAAPVVALALALALPALMTPLRAAFGGAWPRSLRAVGAALLLGALGLNAYELLAVWPTHPATFRSFSPRASAVLRALDAAPPQSLAFVSELPAEYQFHGYEWGVFARWATRQRGMEVRPLRPGSLVPAGSSGQPVRTVLLIWGESDQAVSAAVAAEYPGVAVHKEPNPEPSAGEPSYLYLSAELPYDAIPSKAPRGGQALLLREP